MNPILRLVVALGVAVNVAACGGSGGSGGGGGGPGPAVGTVARVYPPYVGMTDASTFVVRGTSSSPQGIASVSVAGVAATSGDGFATWTATVPLALGANPLDVAATTGNGGVLQASPVTVTRLDALMGSPSALAADLPSGKVWVLEPATSRLLEFSATGSRVVASPGVGSGEDLFNLYGLAVDLAANAAYGVRPNSGGSAVLKIDLASGNRNLVSGAGAGSGVALQSAADGAFDATTKTYFLLDRTAGTLVAVNVDTGLRTTVSGAGTGVGPALPPDSLYRLAADFPAGKLYVVGPTNLFAVSISTGDRTLVASALVGSGPTFEANGLAIDAASNRAFVASSASVCEVASIDLATGNRVILPKPAAPVGGPETSALVDLVYDAALNRVICSDYVRGALVAMDVTTGVRTRLFDSRRGSGSVASGVLGIGLVDDAHAVLLDSTTTNALVKVELATGNRTLLDGTGPGIGNRQAMTIDPVGGRALVASNSGLGNQIIGLDLVTGNRTIVSSVAAPASPTLPPVRALDTDGVTAWCTTTTGAILSADLATGQRAIVADGVTGAGPTLTYTYGLVGVPAEGRLFVSAGEVGDFGIYDVALATGNRTKVSTLFVGSGVSAITAWNLIREAAGTLVGTTTFDGGIRPLTRIDPTTGARTKVVDGVAGPTLEAARFSPYLARPRSDGLLVVADDETNTVILVDPVTGERLVLSR